MNATLSQVFLPVGATVLLASAFAAQRSDVKLVHTIAEGTKVAKTLVHEANLELVKGTMTQAGETEEMPPEFQMELAHSFSATVVDEYGARKDSVLTGLTRVITDWDDRLEAQIVEGDGPKKVQNIELETELVDEAVRWSRGESGYAPALVDEESEIDAEVLSRLVFDLDGLGLLPPADANLEEGWTVPAAALGALLAFGGDPAASPTEQPDDPGACLLRSAVPMPALGELDGDVSLALVGFDEETGRAEISIEADVVSMGVVDEFFQRLGAGIKSERMDGIEALTIESRYELEGEIVWNVAGGHIERFTIGGSVMRLVSMSSDEMQMALELEFEGDASWGIEFAVQ
jgi:hypothetical protein